MMPFRTNLLRVNFLFNIIFLLCILLYVSGIVYVAPGENDNAVSSNIAIAKNSVKIYL
jgi:hypothetical protein